MVAIATQPSVFLFGVKIVSLLVERKPRQSIAWRKAEAVVDSRGGPLALALWDTTRPLCLTVVGLAISPRWSIRGARRCYFGLKPLKSSEC
jgi:hypothetical protein